MADCDTEGLPSPHKTLHASERQTPQSASNLRTQTQRNRGQHKPAGGISPSTAENKIINKTMNSGL